ncbi:hypothetical protein Hanom_Chr17g01585561 [Helianthus anomalus]
MSRGTPVMSAGVQAKISMFLNSSCFICVLISDEMAWPNVTVCSGYLRFNTLLWLSCRNFCRFCWAQLFR